MKKKVPEHNALIFPKVNQNSNFKVFYEYDDGKSGHDNDTFSELSIKLKDKKWIALNGKEFDYSGFIDETKIFYDANENLIQDCSFEDIPQKNKTNVAKLFGDANRYLPIQLNGTTGNNINIRTVIKRNTPPEVLSKGASLITIEKKIDIESGEIY